MPAKAIAISTYTQIAPRIVSSPTVSWRMMRLRITTGAISTSANMMKVEPSPPWRFNSACTRFDTSAMTTRITPMEPARAYVRRVERQQQHSAEQHADEEPAPETLVRLDRDHD